ncbi:MAG: hypothetical protein C0417_10330 [Chlorobiaceae bacterium]|nr:hypothetical protein [Chlorobiaceae bacterium]
MSTDVKEKIKQTINAFKEGDLSRKALNLFNVLGYTTDRQSPLEKPTFTQFKESFISVDSHFDEEKALVKQWKHVDLLFQISKEEVLKQTVLFDTKKVDSTIIETYLFFAIELSREQYGRTELSLITREVNRLFPMPAMILFRHGSTLTLSVINRRLHKRDESKDVLEKVTLIKDINIANPHRAHIEILHDLTFDELKKKFQFTNFVELHNAWQETLNIKELNKRFFQDLANWYFWALQHVEFPNDRKLDKEKNLQINLIRLITRIIFVWFLKEKQLVLENLFNKSFIKSKLKSFDPEGDKAKTYYTAILQNLFFATLNQKMNEREFVKDGNFNTNREQHGIKNKYRYAKQFAISEKEVIELFKEIPFLNGGLFDCLDKDNDETGKHEYIDGFSREEKKTAKIPDMLFFGKSRVLDLSEGYGYKRTKENCRGLLEIFNDYKFTIEENTPIEEEIALDPELLGKVFENLLAYYTPETETTARKQTGSFYTPREIVEYMVDESLISYLKTQMLEENPVWLQLGNLQSDMFGNTSRKGQLPIEQEIGRSGWKDKEAELESNLRQLISYTDEKQLFTDEKDVQELIYAIDHSKILDPACGSGAFAMGILHKFVYVLGKLDKDNVRWRELQKRKAQVEIDNALNESDKKERERKLIDINESFEDNASNYGRKLYLIENCIFGVDIQPIAVQISKLRFFISLVVDQREKKGADNRGIRPLPNLETKFVAANTLIGLEKPAQLPMGYQVIEPLQQKLQQVRHRHFEAKSRQDKLRCQREDKAIRKNIAEELKRLGFGNNDADKVAQFDIYDQNASANWFEPEWMFGKELSKGFDVVIGNPPYIVSKGGRYTGGEFSKEIINYFKSRYRTAEQQFNTYTLFIEFTKDVLSKNGISYYIVPNTFLANEYSLRLREFLTKDVNIHELFATGLAFEAATVETIVLGFGNTKCEYLKIRKGDKFVILKTKDIISLTDDKKLLIKLNEKSLLLIQKLNSFPKLKTFAKVWRGLTTGDDKKFIASSKISKAHKPLITGSDIERYGCLTPQKYVQYTPELLDRSRDERIFLLKEKLVSKFVGTKLTFTYDDRQFYILNSGCVTEINSNDVNIKYLLAVLNSYLLNYYFSNVFTDYRETFPIMKSGNVENLPTPILELQKQSPFIVLVDYILLLKRKKVDSTFIERLIDAMVYELYLPDSIKAAGAEVLKHLNNLPELKEGEDEKNLKTIEKVYKELSDPKHPVNVAMFKMDTIEEIAIIEGKK